MYEFKDKVVIVTGAASGIGRAVALMYAQSGAKIVVSDVNDRLGAETMEMVRKAKGEAVYFRTDVTQASENEKLVDFALNKFGRLDFACNNAGIGGEQNPTGAYSIEGWDKVIATNLSGIFYGMRYEIPAMLKTGGGSIVNMASILGQVAFSGASAYVAAKHGVVGLTRERRCGVCQTRGQSQRGRAGLHPNSDDRECGQRSGHAFRAGWYAPDRTFGKARRSG